MIVGKDFIILQTAKTGIVFRRWVAAQYTYRRLCPVRLREAKLVKKYVYASIASIRFRNSKAYTTSLRDSHIKRYSKIVLYKFFLWLNHYPETLYIGDGMCPTWGVKGKRNVCLLESRELLSVLRNPYRQSLSFYQYKRQRRSKDKKKDYTFVHHLKYGSQQGSIRRMQEDFGIDHTDYPLGSLSYKFIRTYFKDPAKIFTMSAEEFDEYCISDDYKKDMYPIKFFRTETMNRQLCEYLKSKPYLDSRIIDEIFKEAEPKNASRKREDAVWNEETKAYFEKTEKFYIRMVKELAPLPEDDF